MTEPALPTPSPSPSRSPDSVAASAGVVSESEHQSLRADIRRLIDHARPDPRPPRRPGAAGAGRGGPQAVAAGAGERRRGDHAPARRARHRHRRRADPRVLPVLPAREHRRAAAPLPRAALAAPGAAPPAARCSCSGWPRSSPGRRAPRCRPPWSSSSCGRCSPRTPPSRRASRCCGCCAGSARRSTAVRTTTEVAAARRPAVADRRDPPGQADGRRRGERRSAGTWSSWRAAPSPSSSASSSARRAPSGFTVPDDARPMVLGSWVGGDRDGNPFVTPDVTREVVALNADRALRIHLQSVEQLVDELSISTRVVGVSEELRGSLARDRRVLPEVYDRYIRLNRTSPTGSSSPTSAPASRAPARRICQRSAGAKPGDRGGAGAARPRLPGRAGVHRGPAGARPLAARAPGRPHRRRHAGPHAARARRRSGCTWPSSTSASTAASTTPRSGRSTTRSASWTSPTPS